MSPTNDAAAFLGRLLLSVIFVLSGFQKLAEFSGTVAFMDSEGLPLPLIAAIVAVLVECIGSILLIVGYQTRLTGIVLAAWCTRTRDSKDRYPATMSAPLNGTSFLLYRHLQPWASLRQRRAGRLRRL